jgi:alpha-methylacyl-CoA racemase
MLLAYGVVCALLEKARSGQGQVVDAAMVDGASSLMGMIYAMKSMGVWRDERGTNMLDTGSHFYDVYETRDAKYVSIGSIEPQFYALLLQQLGLEGEELPPQMDREQWAALKVRVAEIFKTRTRDEWSAIMEGTDVCYAPVLDLDEAPEHTHLKQRKTFVEAAGVIQPAPAPRFSRTAPELVRPPSFEGQHTDEVLADFGFDAERVAALRDAKAVV